MNIQTAATKMVTPPYMPPGIYFGLDETSYHSDPSLGSSDIRKLAINPSNYWWNSYMNPARKDDNDTLAQSRGSAVHCLVLYGEAEFDRRFMRIPHTDNMSSGEKAATTKKYNILAAAKGMTAIHGQVYDSIAIASAMISLNKHLASALVGGLNEVSIFWRDEKSGIPFKARLDVLKPRGVGDLKSIANKYEKSFPQACVDSIVNYSYHVQAKHYMDARAQIPRFFADGCVHGDHDPAALRAVVAQDSYAWQWVWWQSQGAPITWSKIVSPKNPLLEFAELSIIKARENYLSYVERFGATMWVLDAPPTELFMEEMPAYFGRDTI